MAWAAVIPKYDLEKCLFRGFLDFLAKNSVVEFIFSNFTGNAAIFWNYQGSFTWYVLKISRKTGGNKGVSGGKKYQFFGKLYKSTKLMIPRGRNLYCNSGSERPLLNLTVFSKFFSHSFFLLETVWSHLSETVIRIWER